MCVGACVGICPRSIVTCSEQAVPLWAGRKIHPKYIIKNKRDVYSIVYYILKE